MCGSLFGGGSNKASAQQALADQQAQLRATQAIQPTPPMRADEERRRGVITSLAAARSGSGYSSTVLNGGSGPADYAQTRATLG